MNRYLCIDNFNGMLALTIGKVYTSTKETTDLIWVINDLGYKEEQIEMQVFCNDGKIEKILINGIENILLNLELTAKVFIICFLFHL